MADRWDQIQDLYHRALARNEGERPRFLTEACAGDDSLRQEVESLLKYHIQAQLAMEQPAATALLLESGQQVGSYKILSMLGAGGMGQVYRARDLKLKREVAIKILPEEFSRDGVRVSRFQREAIVLASLNHPHIAAIHDFEKTNGTRYLVLELVEGETLADRIARGPVPFDEAWKIAVQIADALEYAHEQGVVHRDLKPANIKLTTDGVVKLLDFGLAKAFSPEPGEARTDAHTSDSPTLTIGATVAGVILGTAAYMAPEQAKGKRVDKRADIWSWGVVLYELLTGDRLFEGEETTDTLAQVLTKQPDLERVPLQVRKLLTRCLEKDPRNRLRDIGDAMALLDQRPTAPAQARDRSKWAPWTIAALALACLLALSVIHFRESSAAAEAVEFSIEAPPDTIFANPYGGYAPSPDGRYVVFSLQPEKGPKSLWIRPLDSLAARPLPGTEDGNFPTWSPDSKSVAFYADGKLKRIEINGGSPLTLSDAAADNGVSPTGTWNHNGVILFGSSAGLIRVSASPGGGTTLLTKVDPARKEIGHGYPQFLPDGDRFLFFIASADADVQGMYASSLRNPLSRRLILRTDAKAVYVPPRAPYPGSLLWMQGQTLLAQRFDEGSLQLEGDPISVAEGIGRLTPAPIRPSFWASDAGTLIYLDNATLSSEPLVWMSRDGTRIEEVAPADKFGHITLAPDAKSVAVSRVGPSSGQSDIWVRELDRGVMNPLTSNRALNPVWSPDGKWVAFSSDREGGVFQVYRKDVFGAGQEERLTEGPLHKLALDWTHDGRYIFYGETAGNATHDRVMALPLEGGRKPIPVEDGSTTGSLAISPDDRWVAYSSTSSGSLEVYIKAFPAAFPGNTAPQGRKRISIAGGSGPKWGVGGKELYYRSGNALMSVVIQASPQGIHAETPRKLFDAAGQFDFDVTPDGQRFLLLLTTLNREGRRKLTVVTHWQAKLRH